MGRYIGQSDVEQIFGTVNVAKWSNLDNLDESGSPDTTRITTAITYAEDWLDEQLRNGPYTTPLAGTLPQTVKNAVAAMAGVWLYEARGVDDFDGESDNPITAHRNRAQRYVARVLRGEVQLDIERSEVGPSAPVVGFG